MQYALGPNAIPSCPDTSFFAPGAIAVGSIRLGENVGVWFNAVIRGDEIGDNTNIQDGAGDGKRRRQPSAHVISDDQHAAWVSPDEAGKQ
jgi:hypothetical protein